MFKFAPKQKFCRLKNAMRLVIYVFVKISLLFAGFWLPLSKDRSVSTRMGPRVTQDTLPIMVVGLRALLIGHPNIYT